MIRLADVCDINSPPRRRPSPDEVVSFLPMNAVRTDGTTGAGDDRPFVEVSKGYTQLERGDVLVAKITPCFENGKIAQARPRTEVGAGSTEFHVVRPRPGLADARFVLHFLRQPWVRAAGERRMTGSGGQRRVPDAFLRDLTFPSMPLEEQRRIAAVLDQADALRAKRRASLALFDSLSESIFLDMFGDPARNSKGWPSAPIGELLSSLDYGHRFYNESYSEHGTPIVRISDVTPSGELDFEAMPRMQVTAEEHERFVLRVGDLIFARSGATVGKVACIEPNDPVCIAGAYFMILRFVSAIEPLFAKAVLRSTSVQAVIAKQSRQAAQQNFSGPALRRLPMPCPPIGHQKAFVQRLGEAGAQGSRYLESAIELDALFASLQQRAFSGQL